MQCTMQDVFARHFDEYAKGKTLHSRQLQAANCIRTCYTAEQGSHFDYCASAHYGQQTFHACRHRSCPRCADGPRQAWLQAELQRLLPCSHFHVIFTVPHELLGLWEFNREAFAQVLFDCVRASLMEMLAHPRHLGAMPGLLLSLHTWGRTLSHHPHIHALVTAGGITAQGQWRQTREGYLLPLKPLQKLFSGKLLAAVRQALPSWAMPARLPLPHWQHTLRTLYRAHWNIQINPPYAHGKGVALYLARYAKGGPLPKDRTLDLSDGVSFGYTDHRDGRAKLLRLTVDEFITRVLWHAPPKGAHTVRHAGLYATARAAKHRAAVVALACPAATAPPQSIACTLEVPAPPPLPQLACPTCSKPLLRVYLRPAERTRDQISHLVSSTANSPLPTTAALGPTRRSSGHPRAGPAPPSRSPPPVRGQPLAAA